MIDQSNACIWGVLIIGGMWVIGKLIMDHNELQFRKWMKDRYGREPSESEIQQMHDDMNTPHGPV